jgi:ABC-type Zn uptake system ZnuABC Zn-binding protein ZnuA
LSDLPRCSLRYSQFEANRQAFLERLAAAARRWKAILTPYRGVKIVSYHDSWPYFYPAFGLVEGGIIEDRPGIPPSPQHLASLIQQMKAEKVKVILLEIWYPADVAKSWRVRVVQRSPSAADAGCSTGTVIHRASIPVTAVANALQ